MGVFDLFGRSSRAKDIKSANQFEHTTETLQQNNGPVAVFDPKEYGDVEKIIDVLRTGKNVIVHLDKLKPETAIRVLDLLSGAIYALGGGVYEIEQNKNIFMFSPTGVEIR